MLRVTDTISYDLPTFPNYFGPKGTPSFQFYHLKLPPPLPTTGPPKYGRYSPHIKQQAAVYYLVKAHWPCRILLHILLLFVYMNSPISSYR